MSPRRSRAPTKLSDTSNIVLIVGGSERLSVWTDDAAAAASGAFVERTTVAEMATAAAEARPFAIVVPEALCAFDPVEFQALARDVQSQLVVVDEDTMTRETLLAQLVEASQKIVT